MQPHVKHACTCGHRDTGTAMHSISQDDRLMDPMHAMQPGAHTPVDTPLCISHGCNMQTRTLYKHTWMDMHTSHTMFPDPAAHEHPFDFTWTPIRNMQHPFTTCSTHSQHAAPIHNMQHPFTTCSTHSQHTAPIHNTQHPFMPAAICMYDTCMSLFNCNAWHAFTLPMYMCAAHIPSTHALYGPHAYCNTHMHNPCHFSLTLRFGSGLGLSASGGYCVSGTPHHREGVMSGDDL